MIAAQVSESRTTHNTKASDRANNQALRNLQQQLKVVHQHALERTPSAIPTEAEQRATKVSNIFKSLAGSALIPARITLLINGLSASPFIRLRQRS